MILDRYPIFYTVEKQQLEMLKLRIKYGEKYKYRITLPKSLIDFPKTSNSAELSKGSMDNLITHKKKLPNGDSIMYHGNSKYFMYVDPSVKDARSIQFAPCSTIYLLVKNPKNNLWVFPSLPMTERESMTEVKKNLISSLTKDKMQIYMRSQLPVLCEKRPLFDYEKGDPMNSRFVGVKTFYFYASHIKGQIDTIKSAYAEYIFTTRKTLNQYMDE